MSGSDNNADPWPGTTKNLHDERIHVQCNFSTEF